MKKTIIESTNGKAWVNELRSIYLSVKTSQSITPKLSTETAEVLRNYVIPKHPQLASLLSIKLCPSPIIYPSIRRVASTVRRIWVDVASMCLNIQDKRFEN